MINKEREATSGYSAPSGPPPPNYYQDASTSYASQPKLNQDASYSGTYNGNMPQNQQQGWQPPQGETAAQMGERYRAELYARCAVGNHERERKYGICGIICAVVFFPIGLICLFADTEERCMRCGKRL